MKHNIRATALAGFLALTVVLGAMSGATLTVTATQTTVDTSTSDATSSVSEVQNKTTIGANNTFSANGSESSTIQYITDSNESEVAIKGPSGVEVYTNGSADQLTWNNTDNDGHFNVTVNHDALADLERGINANVTTTWTVTNNTSAANPNTTDVTVYVESDDSATVEVVSDADVDEGDIASVTEDSYNVLDMNITAGPLWSDKSTLSVEDRSINGSETDVVMVLGNSSVAEDFNDVTEDAEAGDRLSSLRSLNRNVVLATDGDGEIHAVPVYYDEVPDDVEDSDTYAVQTTVGGQDALEVNLGDTFEDADEVTVDAVGSAGLFTHMTDYLMAGVSNTMLGFLGFLPSDLGFGIGGDGATMIGSMSWVPMAGKRLGA